MGRALFRGTAAARIMSRAPVFRPATAAALALLLSGCEGAMDTVRALGNEHAVVAPETMHRVLRGDPERGRRLLTAHACNTCHMIPGERAPAAHVGPPLTGFARRTNIGGSLPNRPETLVHFIMDAPRELPGTGMPDLQVSEPEARDIAALLYTLR